MNVLVTGGQGFLGKYVTGLLGIGEGSVISLDNMNPLCGGTEEPNVRGDVRNPYTLRETVEKFGITHVVHLAAFGRNLTCQDFPDQAWETNVTGTKEVLEMARTTPSIKRVVCCSSNITLSPRPTVYKATKEAVEKLVEAYTSLGVSCMALRPSNIYGKGQSKTEYQPCAFAGLDKGFSKDGHFTVTGDGTQSRDWVHAADVAAAFYLALKADCTGTVDVCTGRLTSINEIASMLEVPVLYTEARRGDAKELVSDPEPASKLLNFSATMQLEQSLADAFPEVLRIQRL
jgi:UDP-glucose 4-epimerase